ncbi:hypothetical protein LXM50_05660 [Microbacterium sp. Au-Mic1]|uniref:hypothetical protein n=1 Tax=Microbacterium sp. Au-Mic1 TaxID=2906457 RepID=UPI001E649B83|nr:hypothetical protein [Microbacterium sp. Au-Mic1]MCE4025452.1 hypothetical protein [Microbacterium sp. Au-Mic1]
MRFMLGSPGATDEPLPDWDVYEVDAFGRPGRLLGGVMGVAATHEEALAIFISMWPEYSGSYVHIVRSTVVPPWSTYDGA